MPSLRMRATSLHRKPPFRQAGGLPAHQALKPIFDRLNLHRAPRQRDLRSGMTSEIVRFQHAERRVHPAQTRVPLMEGRGNRQGVAFRDRLLRRRQAGLLSASANDLSMFAEIETTPARSRETTSFLNSCPLTGSGSIRCPSAREPSQSTLVRPHFRTLSFGHPPAPKMRTQNSNPARASNLNPRTQPLFGPRRIALTKARWSRRFWSAYSTANSQIASSNVALEPM